MQQFLPLPQTPLVFMARSYGNLSSRCWNPGLCGLAWGLDCLLLMYPSWFLYATHECGTALSETTAASVCHTVRHTRLYIFAPATHLDECGFFKSLVIGLSNSSIFWQFWVLFVLRFSCNSLCGCMRRWSMSTCTSNLTRKEKDSF